jgi:hypothetical protein
MRPMRRGFRLVFVALLFLATVAIFFAGQRDNPPGFYLDEASIGYNALLIAHTGADEHGERFPFYFRAFGEYKNPTYIYVLAGVFRFMEPSNLVARRTAAIIGFLGALAMGLLAWRITGRRWIVAVTFLTSLFTPALFEISRLAFEVCCFPVVLALFLILAHTASMRPRWSARLVVSIAATLVLLTVTYSIGRLLAPLLVAGLGIFLTRERFRAWIAIGVLYAIFGVIPLLIFQHRHNRALTQHFRDMTYLNGATAAPAISGFEQHFADNLLPLGMSLMGDPNDRHHVQHSGGSILLMTFIAVAIAVVATFRERDRWLLFLCYGTLASVVPSSLTIDRYHTLRLVAYPVFLIALSISALQRLRWKPLAAALVAVGVVQATYFLIVFHERGRARGDAFEVGSRQVVNGLIDLKERPIYLPQGPMYALAYWYGAQRGLSANAFAILPAGTWPPPGSLLMTDGDCDRCELLLANGRYRAYRTPR